ncbi:hypothetical protein D3C72_1702020 [compost metagenome]
MAPWLSCSAVADISWLPAATLRVADVTSLTTSRSLRVMALRASIRSLISSLDLTEALALRLPSATSLARRTALDKAREIETTIQVAATRAMRAEPISRPISSTMDCS